jgi:polar amino acid transport system substrate-binding protein
MYKFRRYVWLYVSLTIFVGILLFAYECAKAEGSAPLVLKIGTAYPHAPYCFGKGKGIRGDIVSTILDRLGQAYSFHSYSLNRARQSIKTMSMDISLVAPKDGVIGYLSEPYVYYSNVAVTLADSGILLNSIAELAPYNVAAWQGANKVLGAEFAELFPNAGPRYHEVPHPTAMPHLLQLGRAEVVIIDKFVFQYEWNQIADKQEKAMPDVIFHPIFPARSYFSAAFKDQALRDAFNRELKALKAEGEIEKIYRRYVPSISEVDLKWSVE